jgi:hypothetical protein
MYWPRRATRCSSLVAAGNGSGGGRSGGSPRYRAKPNTPSAFTSPDGIQRNGGQVKTNGTVTIATASSTDSQRQGERTSTRSSRHAPRRP